MHPVITLGLDARLRWVVAGSGALAMAFARATKVTSRFTKVNEGSTVKMETYTIYNQGPEYISSKDQAEQNGVQFMPHISGSEISLSIDNSITVFSVGHSQ